jgi:hypothetical protein
MGLQLCGLRLRCLRCACVCVVLWLQTGGLRGDGRLFVNTLEVADVTKVDAGLSFPSFIVDTGLFINMGGLMVSCIQAAPALCRMRHVIACKCVCVRVTSSSFFLVDS